MSAYNQPSTFNGKLNDVFNVKDFMKPITTDLLNSDNTFKGLNNFDVENVNTLNVLTKLAVETVSISLGRLTNAGQASVSIGGSCGNSASNQAVAIGTATGYSQKDRAISIGNVAGIQQDAGSIAIGSQSGQTQLQKCVSIGEQSGKRQTGSENTCLGYRAGYNNDLTRSGNSNTFVGIDTGSLTGSYSNSVAIGAYARAEGNNSVAIGSNAVATTSNQIMMGSATHTVSIIGSLKLQNTDAIKGMCCGFANCGGTVAVGTVNFDTTFYTAPMVVATILSNSTTQVFSIQIYNITTAGFQFSKTWKIIGSTAGGQAASENFNWIAMGK